MWFLQVVLFRKPWRYVCNKALRNHFKHSRIVDPIHIEIAIQGKNLPQIGELGGGNQRGICQVHGCVAVLLHELPHPRLFRCSRGVDLEYPLLYIAPYIALQRPSSDLIN